MSMIRNTNFVRHSMAAIAAGWLISLAAPAFAEDAMQAPDDVYNQIQTMMGGVPGFLKQVPKAALGGFWALERDLEFSDKTALDAKTKALISLAVASQIPCQYCVWADTNTLKQMGATDEEIGEAVSMAGLTRYASTTLNGLQVDFEQFKKDMGGQ
jgi:AhpD family alkylhydroperoxidase